MDAIIEEVNVGRSLVLVKPDIDLIARMLIAQHGADVRAMVAMKVASEALAGS